MSCLYPYLVAGLPELTFTTTIKDFDYCKIYRHLQRHLTGSDAKVLRLLLLGLTAHQQTPFLYLTAAKNNCRFIRVYFDYDRLLRNAQVVAAAKTMNAEPYDYIVGDYDPADCPEEIARVINQADILEREEQLDRLRWQKANELSVFNYLDIEYLLAYVTKASIVDRWMRLDKAKGEAFFKLLVTEVRGTFDIRKTL